MTTDFDRSRLQAKSRFGQLSKNMFFARHVAQPRYLKFITGASGQRVCHVREEPLRIPFNSPGDVAKSLMSDPRFNIEFSPNSFNETLLRSYADRIEPKKRRERLLPPLPGWNPTGTVVEDTDNWRRELARIAEMVGLVTADELSEIENRKETPIQAPSSPVFKSAIPIGQYSRQTGRWNETPKTANRSRSLHRRTPLNLIVPHHLFCVDEQEREMWMLQVLCQILQTESLNEIQSWLVSSGPSEKDAVRQLITTAIKGLQENGRIQPTAYYGENVKGTQVNMDTFGSLLAHRFPRVSSSANSRNEHSSKSSCRPRTAPQIQTEEQPKTEFHSKSAGVFQTNLEPIDENTETGLLNTTKTVPQSTKIDHKRDVQILTLSDDENKTQQITNGEKEQVPF